MNQYRLYNVIFPIWLLLLIHPIFWLALIPSNFIIDSLVIYVALKMLNIESKKTIYKKTILLVVLFGFLADFIGAGLLLLAPAIPIEAFQQQVLIPLYNNPFSNIYSFIFISCILLLTGYLIYVFNRYISFRKTDLSNHHKHLVALYLAIFTTPYLFLIPTQFIYGY